MKNHQRASHTPTELLSDLQTVMGEAETMMADAVSEHSADAFRDLRTRFIAARDRFTDVYDEARKKVVAGAECTDATIRANPYQSLAIALGVGLVAGVLIGRRSR